MDALDFTKPLRHYIEGFVPRDPLPSPATSCSHSLQGVDDAIWVADEFRGAHPLIVGDAHAVLDRFDPSPVHGHMKTAFHMAVLTKSGNSSAAHKTSILAFLL